MVDSRAKPDDRQESPQQSRVLLLEDDPIYREVADHVFNVTHTNPDQAARHIVEKFL